MYKYAVTSVTDSIAQTLMLISEGMLVITNTHIHLWPPSEKIGDNTTLFAVVLWYYLAAVI